IRPGCIYNMGQINLRKKFLNELLAEIALRKRICRNLARVTSATPFQRTPDSQLEDTFRKRNREGVFTIAARIAGARLSTLRLIPYRDIWRIGKNSVITAERQDANRFDVFANIFRSIDISSILCFFERKLLLAPRRPVTMDQRVTDSNTQGEI